MTQPVDPTPVPAPAPAPQGDGLKQRAVTGVLWTAMEKWSVRLSTLVGFIILGNLLSPLEFGIVALATTFISFLTTVADGGFGIYLVQKQRLTATATSTAFFVSSGLGLVLSLGLVALAPPMSRLLDVPELTSVLPALAVALLIAGVSVVPAALMARDMRFKELAMRQMLATIVSVVVAIALAIGGAGVWALVAQTLVRSAVALVVLWATSGFRPRWTFDSGEARAMTSFGGKALAVNLQTQIRSQGELFIIGALAGPVTLGYWTVAGRLVNVVVDVFSSVVGAVAHPVFAKLQEAPERLARALGSTRALTALVLVPALVLLALLSEDVVPAVFGEQWAPTTTVASLLALSALLQTMSNFDRSALLATGHPGAELAVTTTFITIQLALAFVFHSELELLAAGIGLSMGLSIPVRLLVVRRLLGVPLRNALPSAAIFLAGGISAAAVILAAAAFDLQDIAYVVVAVLLGLAVYAAAVVLVARPVVQELVGIVRGVVSRKTRARSAA